MALIDPFTSYTTFRSSPWRRAHQISRHLPPAAALPADLRRRRGAQGQARRHRPRPRHSHSHSHRSYGCAALRGTGALAYSGRRAWWTTRAWARSRQRVRSRASPQVLHFIPPLLTTPGSMLHLPRAQGGGRVQRRVLRFFQLFIVRRLRLRPGRGAIAPGERRPGGQGLRSQPQARARPAERRRRAREEEAQPECVREGAQAETQGWAWWLGACRDGLSLRTLICVLGGGEGGRDGVRVRSGEAPELERKRLCEDDDDTHDLDALLGSSGAFPGKDPDGCGPGRRAQSPGSPRVTTGLLTDSWK